jgi:hypothetical protein
MNIDGVITSHRHPFYLLCKIRATANGMLVNHLNRALCVYVYIYIYIYNMHKVLGSSVDA